MNHLIRNTFTVTTVATSGLSSIALAKYCYLDVTHTNNIFPKNIRMPLGIYSGILGGMTGALFGGVVGATFPISYPMIGYYLLTKSKENL